MPARNEARDGILFVAAGLFAGLGNYAFQIFASSRLSVAEFARFSGWLAHLAAAFIVAGLVQYAANFHPIARAHRGKWLVGLNALALALVATWFFTEDPLGLTTAISIVGLAAIHGWAIGQNQIRLHFSAIALAQITNSIVRLVIPILVWSALAGYAFGIAFSFVPALWILSWRLFDLEDVAETSKQAASWAAPALLAVASNLLPQFDLILMQHTQSSGDFDQFARASLFYKGIYFFVFIFAQWLLPRQIRGGGSVWLGQGAVALVAGVTSVVLAFGSPLVAKFVFHWVDAPSTWLVLSSCLHMSLLTLIFIFVQAECAKSALRGPLVVMLVLALEAALQLAIQLPMMNYFAVALVVQMIVIGSALRLTSPRAA